VLTDISKEFAASVYKCRRCRDNGEHLQDSTVRKADHHILNFHRFEKPNSHSYFSLFIAGIGYGQMFASLMILLYFGSLMALIGFYLIYSFTPELPWSTCYEGWGDKCIDINQAEVNSSCDTNSTCWRPSHLFF
jgi:hypothetical protein